MTFLRAFLHGLLLSCLSSCLPVLHACLSPCLCCLYVCAAYALCCHVLHVLPAACAALPALHVLPFLPACMAYFFPACLPACLCCMHVALSVLPDVCAAYAACAALCCLCCVPVLPCLRCLCCPCEMLSAICYHAFFPTGLLACLPCFLPSCLPIWRYLYNRAIMHAYATFRV